MNGIALALHDHRSIRPDIAGRHRLRAPRAIASPGGLAVTSIDENSAGRASPPTTTAADHAALVLAVANQRDKAAFAALFTYFAPRLKSFLMRAGTPPAAAEELAQETMLAVWRKASYFDPAKAGAAAWIFAIARNLRIDSLRRQRRAGLAEPAAGEEIDDTPPADALMASAQREARLREVLAALSEEQARVITLSFFQDKPHSEIARELGIPLGTVKSRLRLAMTRLRALLGDI